MIHLGLHVAAINEQPRFRSVWIIHNLALLQNLTSMLKTTSMLKVK